MSTATIVRSRTDTPTVYAPGNIWLSNEARVARPPVSPDPNYSSSIPSSDHRYQIRHQRAHRGENTHGTAATTGTGQCTVLISPYSSPAKVGFFTVRPGATLTITARQQRFCFVGPWHVARFLGLQPATPEQLGTLTMPRRTACIRARHLPDVTQPLGSMNAVFTGLRRSQNTIGPGRCRRPWISAPQAERDYMSATSSPKLQQAFYVGNGHDQQRPAADGCRAAGGLVPLHGDHGRMGVE